MAPLSFTIETKLSPDEVIDLVRGVSNASDLTKAEGVAIIRAFSPSRWPKPNALSAHPAYESFISFSKYERTVYLGLIVPLTERGGTKIIFGVDWKLVGIGSAFALFFIILGLSKLPNADAVFVLAASFLLVLPFFFGLNYKIKWYRRLIHKMLNLPLTH